MATATAPSKQDEALNLLKGFNDRLTKQESAIEGLLKLAETPASKAGVSPQEYLRGMASQNGAVAFGADGAALKTKGRKNRDGLGEVRYGDKNEKGSFGHWLKNFHDFHVGGGHQAECFQTLKQYGTGQLKDGPNGAILKTALAESSAITGGYTVPPMFEEQLFQLAIEDVIVQPKARKYPLTARTLQIPCLDQTNTTNAAVAGQPNLLGGVVASWMAEAATRNESEPLFRQTVLTAWELSFYALASNTLLADNAVGLDALLTQLFGYAIGWYTDYAYFQGTGVGQPLGLLNSPAAVKVTRQNTNHFTFTDVVTMYSKMYWLLRGGNSLVWCVSPSVIPDLLRLNDNAANSTYATGGTYSPGRVLFIPFNQGLTEDVPQSAGVQSAGWLLGKPVFVTEKLPALGTTGDVCLFDLDKYALGQRMDMEIMVSPHVKFLNNQMAWRIVWRGDGQPLLNNPVTLADASSKVSPFVLLQ